VALEVELLIMIIFSVSCLNGEDGHGGGVVIVLNGVVSFSFYLT
jgi:hypothetical protein